MKTIYFIKDNKFMMGDYLICDKCGSHCYVNGATMHKGYVNGTFTNEPIYQAGSDENGNVICEKCCKI